MTDAIRLIVGLGNVGAEYERTRHNAGFWFVDEVARKAGARFSDERKFHGAVARVRDGARELWLLKPGTYMNRSGQSVVALALYYKILPTQVLVAHDELDLPPGDARLKKGGGHAGHNGLRDIHAQLGSPDYWRLRLGIGHPGHKSEVANWVLKKPAPAQRDALQAAIERSVRALPDLLAGRPEKATVAIHTSKPPRPKPPKPAASGADTPS